MACELGCAYYYAIIVMAIFKPVSIVASVLITMIGAGDVIGASMIVDECTYAAGLIPLLLNGLGVVTIMTGVLTFYVMAREIELELLFTNVYWKSYRIIVWIIMVLTYSIGLAMVAILEIVTSGVEDSGCVEVRKYALFRVFATVALPVAPVVLVAIIIVIAITLLVLFCVCKCVEGVSKETEDQ